MLNTEPDSEHQCENTRPQSDLEKVSQANCDSSILNTKVTDERKTDTPGSNSASIKTEKRTPSPSPPANLHMDVQFTNFFIDEILKPHFGKVDSIRVQHCSPMVTSVKSECGAFSRSFSGFIHKPIPTFKQIYTIPNERPVSNAQPTDALDLRQEKNKLKTQCVKPHSDNVFRKQHHALANSQLQTGKISHQTTSRASCSARSPSPASSVSSNCTSTGSTVGEEEKGNIVWPAWVYCTRYSDRPSSGPRSRRTRRKERAVDEKRPRTAFSTNQLERLKREFDESRYLSEQNRQDLAKELNLNESQIKIWFQNKRAKLKKAEGGRNGLALHLMAQGLYNHATMTRSDVDEIDVES